MLHTFPMIFEALFIVLPGLIGLGVTAERGWRALGTWVVLETLLFWLATTGLRQPLLAAGVTTLLLGTTGFGGGLLLSRKRRLRAFAAPGLAFLCGVLLTGAVGGALASPPRTEVVKTAKWVNAEQARASAKLIEVGSEAPLRMAWESEGSGEPSTHLQLELEDSQLSRQLFRVASADFWLTPQDERTHVLRVTSYESRLMPAWLWGPVERRMVVAEHLESLQGLDGRFVSADEEGVDVKLTVQTNPPTVVTVVPPSGSERPRLVLGRSPIFQKSGARVGDTVLLQNEAAGVNSWEIIEYGRPGELKVISRVFGKKAE